ncbi:MAG TPA: protein kinase [Bryobacteraceae bacterium]|nr:protein kinase [Bryobacteraceae bacterium]
MPLATGARLGPYEILTPIGAGGMGEVYKARDTRLDRTVAIKLSKEAFSERFEREARAIAALNHPNICQLYDVGPNYLVMEFIEGTPVASVDAARKLLDIAVQIADGLAAAHAAGIVHRDLKPDNILITREGRVKILDFGLAKAVIKDTLADATRTVGVTDAGTTVGTIAYMSPEQARGSVELTPQSDQFSLGLVLYELASGHRAFRRDSAAETMTAIIREDADPLPGTVPAPLRWIVERLLAKEPADRYDSTRDLYRELRQVRERLTESTSGVQAASSARMPTRVTRWPKTVVVALAAAVLGALASWILHPGSGTDSYRFTPMEVSWENPLAAIWSPDGKAFTYVAGAPGDQHVFVRYLDSPTPVMLTHNAADWYVAGWSPDGKRVIARSKNPQGDKPPFALFSVPAFGGDPVLIMPLDMPYPRVSADGVALAAVNLDDRKLAVYTASPVGSPLKKYTPAPYETGSFLNSPLATFAPDRRSITLLLDQAGGRQVWKLPYPPGTGVPERIMKNLASTGSNSRVSWFSDGRTALMSYEDAQGQHLWFAGIRSGALRRLMMGTPSESEAQPSLSPDGRKLLYTQIREDSMIVSASLSDATVKRVISSELDATMPTWARNKPEFVYSSTRSGDSAIWIWGEGGDRPIVTQHMFPAGTSDGFMTASFSPNADRVVYSRMDNNQQIQSWISSVSGGPPVRLTTASNVFELGGSWSPDGSKIVYWSTTEHVPTLRVVNTTGEAAPAMLRQHVGGALPTWSPDGQWISFTDDKDSWNIISPDGKTVRSFGEPKTIQMTFSPDSKLLYGIRKESDRCVLYSIDIASAQEKTIGQFSIDFAPSSPTSPGIQISIAPDGKSILFPARRVSSSLWMLEGFDRPGWLDELRERLPW